MKSSLDGCGIPLFKFFRKIKGYHKYRVMKYTQGTFFMNVFTEYFTGRYHFNGYVKVYRENGLLLGEDHYSFRKTLHSITGPAHIVYDEDMIPLKMEFWLHGEKVPFIKWMHLEGQYLPYERKRWLVKSYDNLSEEQR